MLAPTRAPIPAVELELTDVRRDHLLTLVDDVGIVQHAHGVIPNRETGYCVDDVARLAVVALELARRHEEQPWNTILYRALAFLHAATDRDGGGMHNFMSYERTGSTSPHTGDHVGRSIWALGEVLSTAWVPASSARHAACSTTLVASSGRRVARERPRTRCSASRALDADRLEPTGALLLQRLVEQLAAAHASERSDAWRGSRTSSRYDNARLPHALIVGGTALGRERTWPRSGSSRSAGSATSAG